MQTNMIKTQKMNRIKKKKTILKNQIKILIQKMKKTEPTMNPIKQKSSIKKIPRITKIKRINPMIQKKMRKNQIRVIQKILK